MTKKTLISVIIPSYNRSDFIVDAINSVLGQDGDWNLDIIVIDDGSTDDTESKLKQFKDKISFYKIPHSGLPAVARNFGIAKAKGELIAFQDSDDIWVKDKLTYQVPMFDDSSVMMTFGNAETINEKGIHQHKQLVDDSKLIGGEEFQKLLVENVISTLTVMVRRNALEILGLFNETSKLKAVEDYELWLRITAHYPSGIKCLRKTLAYYRIHSRNVSAASDLLAVERLVLVYEKIWDTDLSRPQREALGRQSVNMQEGWTRLKIEAGDVPAVSVVMSVYNGGLHLAEAIKSILDQTFKDFEFIIIDDGSNDSTQAIIKSFNDPRIRLVRQTNHGLVDSLNIGARLARAVLVARMDADDISLPSRLEQEVSLMYAHPRAGAVGTFFTYIDEAADKAVTIIQPFKHLDLKRALYIENAFAHGSTMFRKEAFQEAGGYSKDYGPTEDYALWPLIADGWELHAIPEVLYLYRITLGSISQSSGSAQAKYSRQIQNQRWHKPFVYKSPQKIVEDGKFYKEFSSIFAKDIYEKYISHQRLISVELFKRGRLVLGVLNSMGTCWLRPSLFFGLSLSFFGCLMTITGVMAKRN